MFDILSHHTSSLLFEPQCLICMGSPLGMFLPLQQELLTFRKRFRPFAPPQPAPAAAVAATAANVTSSLASSPDIHARERIPIINVFHPNDPVASRLEPLLDPSAALIPPAHCTQSNSGFNNSSITGEGEIMKLMAHVRSLCTASTGQTFLQQANSLLRALCNTPFLFIFLSPRIFVSHFEICFVLSDTS